MVENILSNIICHEFDKKVGKCQGQHNFIFSKSKEQHAFMKAMHVGFDMNPSGEDQYEVVHMYLYAPMNYVYVAIQTERITENGTREVGQMQILSYHDSCWRSAVDNFVFKNRQRLCVLKSNHRLDDWYDVLTLTEQEELFLDKLEQSRRNSVTLDMPNPFDERGIWVGK